MKITVNGKEITLKQQITIKELLVVEKAEMPEYVTVQVNDELIDHDKFAATLIHDGDVVEFLYFMGGGQL
jgi:sulfur carrier protein